MVGRWGACYWPSQLLDMIINETGEVTGVVHVVRDITERKRAEEKTKKSRGKYRGPWRRNQSRKRIWRMGQIHIYPAGGGGKITSVMIIDDDELLVNTNETA